MTQTALQRHLSKNGKKGAAVRAARLSAQRRREIARLGGIASGKSRKRHQKAQK